MSLEHNLSLVRFLDIRNILKSIANQVQASFEGTDISKWISIEQQIKYDRTRIGPGVSLLLFSHKPIYLCE